MYVCMYVCMYVQFSRQHIYRTYVLYIACWWLLATTAGLQAKNLDAQIWGAVLEGNYVVVKLVACAKAGPGPDDQEGKGRGGPVGQNVCGQTGQKEVCWEEENHEGQSDTCLTEFCFDLFWRILFNWWSYLQGFYRNETTGKHQTSRLLKQTTIGVSTSWCWGHIQKHMARRSLRFFRICTKVFGGFVKCNSPFLGLFLWIANSGFSVRCWFILCLFDQTSVFTHWVHPGAP